MTVGRTLTERERAEQALLALAALERASSLDAEAMERIGSPCGEYALGVHRFVVAGGRFRTR